MFVQNICVLIKVCVLFKLSFYLRLLFRFLLLFYLFFSRLGHPPFGRVLLAECTGHCPDQLLDSLAQSELTRKTISVLCPDDKFVCVCA